jgi:diketogulonate reductase-like aldo/keto reductase
MTESVTLHAFRTGYRHVDSARAYRNEQPCADAMRASGIPREEIFFTTKVAPRSMGYEATKVRTLTPTISRYPGGSVA